MSDLDAIREAHDGPHECWNGGPNTEWCEDRCDTRVVLDALDSLRDFDRRHYLADADRLAEALRRLEATVDALAVRPGLDHPTRVPAREALRQHDAAKEAERE